MASARPRVSDQSRIRLKYVSEWHDEEQARFFVMGLVPRVDVVAPAALRDRVATDLAAGVDRLGLVAPRR
jgi:hypothetical protein